MTVRTQDGVDLVEVADVLRRKGHVRGEPVAISLFHDQIPASFTGARVEPCAIVHRAMDLGETVFVDAEYQNCLAGAWQAGFIDPPEQIKTGRYLADGIPGFVPIAAERVKTGLNVLPQGTVRGIGAAPLDQVPDGVRVDVVVVVCEPVFAATIGGVRTAVDGTPPRGAAGSSLCGELFAIPYHEENVIITPGDMGGRMFNKIRPSEMFVIIPFRFIDHLRVLLGSTPDVQSLMESIKPGFTDARRERLRERAARQGAPLVWDADVEELLARAPEGVRAFARTTLEEYAREHNHERITMEVVHKQMESVGMRLEDVLGSDEQVPPTAEVTMEIDRKAPVTSATQVDIAASPEVVWKVIADVAGWSEVYPQIKEVSVGGPVAAGVAVSFKAGPAAIKGALEVVQEPRLLAFKGSGMGATSIYVFRIEPTADGARLSIEQSMGGLAVRPMKGMLQKIADSSLLEWAHAIAARATGSPS